MTLDERALVARVPVRLAPVARQVVDADALVAQPVRAARRCAFFGQVLPRRVDARRRSASRRRRRAAGSSSCPPRERLDGALGERERRVGHDEVAGRPRARLPRPLQSGQAPYGLLNEKSRGASSSIETPCTGHASACENGSSSPSTTAIDDGAARRAAAPSRRCRRGAADAVLHHEPVDDDVDVVLVLLVEHDLLVELAHLAVDAHAREALALAGPRTACRTRPCGPCTTGASTWNLVPSGSSRMRSTICSRRLPLDDAAADRAVRDADARVEQAQVVVDLGDGAHRRARVAATSSSGRSRRPATGPRCGRRRACPSARGTAARTPRATRRSGAGPRRRWCRTRASACPSRTGR